MNLSNKDMRQIMEGVREQLDTWPDKQTIWFNHNDRYEVCIENREKGIGVKVFDNKEGTVQHVIK